ncbi:hypothetical protein HPP92_002247 [Vanilla planifolia]|uniref:Carbohydrate kinase PfkB domain-containing protein n=1 Tax=Vanilla planifolia TaxID=51239 RepID=A0A835RSM5_VANPL|nr:hypothetical protein HPP92_002247 [Vanilla planifolia]
MSRYYTEKQRGHRPRRASHKRGLQRYASSSCIFSGKEASPFLRNTQCSIVSLVSFCPLLDPMGRVDVAAENHHTTSSPTTGGVLVVGNYCHDVIYRDGIVVGKGLGGAASFLSNLLDPLCSAPASYISKVGADFSDSVSNSPITSSSCPTTLFHAYFPSAAADGYHGDRVLRRVRVCEPIFPSDLPSENFEFGLAAGVAGEILPETLAFMLDLCRFMFVDVQGLIRVFDPNDGAVGLVPLRSSAFFDLIPRIRFLKASADEAPFVDIEEVRKLCCVIVTEGKDGCKVYCGDDEIKVAPFPALQIDPTGAGDSFLGGFVVGLSWGLTVPDAALLGNFFGALTVGQVGIPKFEKSLLKAVRQELERRRSYDAVPCQTKFSLNYQESVAHQEFRESLLRAAELSCISGLTEIKDENRKKN